MTSTLFYFYIFYLHDACSSELKALNSPLLLQSMESQEYFDCKNPMLCSMNDGKWKHVYERNKHF